MSESSSPRVSIGLAAYNGERFIRQALDSLLAQNFPDFELIISDDASTDGTEAICREYAQRDSRIRYIRQESNIGAAANFDFVLSQARSRYFMWASDDDVWKPDFISTLLPLLEANPTAVLATGAVDVIDVEGRRVRGMLRDWPRLLSAGRLRAVLAVLSETTGADTPSFLYGLICAEALRRTGAYNVAADRWDVYGGADLNILFSLLMLGPIVMEVRTLFHKRYGPGRSDYPQLEGMRAVLTARWGYEATRARLGHAAIRRSDFGKVARLILHLAVEAQRIRFLVTRLWPVLQGAGASGVRRILGGRHRAMPEPYRSRLSTSLRDWMIEHQIQLAELGRVSWLGVPTFKCALDLWMYQEIIYRTQPDVIVEIGSYYGGSTLYLATICEALGHGQVVSVDIDRTHYQARHARIVEITGDSAAPETVRQVAHLCAGKKTMVIQDGAHDQAAVWRDLQAYADLVSPGCYFIVEDATVDIFQPGDGLGRDWAGPLPAIEEFLKQRSDYLIDEACERYRITYSPRGYLRRKP